MIKVKKIIDVVVFIGSILNYKNLERLLAAFVNLKASNN